MEKICWEQMYKMESAVTLLLEQAYTEIYKEKKDAGESLGNIIALSEEIIGYLKGLDPETTPILENIYDYLKSLKVSKLSYKNLKNISHKFCNQIAVENGYNKDTEKRWYEYQDRQTIVILSDIHNDFSNDIIENDEFPIRIETLKFIIIKSNLNAKHGITPPEYIKEQFVELHEAFIANLIFFFKRYLAKRYTYKQICQILERTLKKTVKEQTFNELDITQLSEYFEVDYTENPDDYYEEYSILPKS